MTDFAAVVAGAGAAGLTTAIALAQAGRDVLLLEAKATFQHGCNTSMSTAMIPAAGTRWQQANGVDDSPERFLGDVLQKTAGSADRRISEALTGAAAEVVTWLSDDCGVELDLVTDFQYPGHSAHRCHTTSDRSGRTLHRQLVDLARANPRITFGVPLRLVDVSVDEQGAVSGAVVASPAGGEEVASSSAVILATNGFAADAEAVRRWLPEIADGLYFGGDGSTGDAIAIGGRIGADLDYLDAYQGHGTVAYPHGVLVTFAVIAHGGIVVNTAGRRFDDETRGYSEFAAKVLAQPEGRAWVIFDERIDGLCRSFADFEDLVATNAIVRASSLPELREAIRCGPALEETLRAARVSAEGREPDEFGRNDWEAALEAPFAAVSVTGALFHTQGGLVVDERARVQRDGRSIPGLYAAGGAAVGMSGRGASGYLAGNGLLAAFGLGYLAARDVAAR